MRVLSGIQPSGAFHLGNYFGAIRQYIDLQEDNEAFYFIANLHALTSLRDRTRLEDLTRDAAVDLLALGLNPEKAHLFIQSDVPEVSELTWLLMTVTPMGLLERCHAYKDKVSQGLPAEHGLFSYPVLMAADILIYDSEVVPVGQDQKQHLEVTRDIASSFNHMYGDVFRLPEPLILKEGAVVPGLDGQKMSKSYNNTIEIFEMEKAQRKKIMRIVTDSVPVEDSKNPDTCNVFQIYKLVVSDADRDAMKQRYHAGGLGYGEVKKELAEAVVTYFAEARSRREALLSRGDDVSDILKMGAIRAREKASEILDRAQKACGIGRMGS
ncbi:MAG: tryptophan--tRNA ligase [Planctomycetota bacterium]|jgi:tryptophanyl-tRNA synthetase|nr:tryptophan--tRNA ligase [Planctomycetota bacterium]